MTRSTERFSNRVADYARYRPGYPEGLAVTLEVEAGLSSDSVVVDVGSGTGISSRIFLERGCTVFGVEPNAEMRRRAEETLGEYPRFTSVDATAESTSLPDTFADFVTAAQAFHWFDPESTRREFKRLLKPCGMVVLVWNDRRTAATAFLRDYERLLRRFGTDYRQVDHKRVGAETLRDFFRGPFKTRTFYNEQIVDYPSLKGRLLSSSYVPSEEDPASSAMLNELARLFEAYESGGHVALQYDTVLHFGHLP